MESGSEGPRYFEFLEVKVNCACCKTLQICRLQFLQGSALSDCIEDIYVGPLEFEVIFKSVSVRRSTNKKQATLVFAFALCFDS